MTNWKTTLSGIIGGLAAIFGQAIVAYVQNRPVGPIEIHQVIVGVVLAFLGIVAKDHDVTGGTKQQ